jgi:formylglycine-generating enzyme required for sulfatase activity
LNQDWIKEETYALPNATPLPPDKERALQVGDPIKECTDCPEMVVVPARPQGFMMGEPEDQHEVKIPNPFAVGKFELTFDEWKACAAHGPCYWGVSDGGWGRGRRPVINVSWDDAQTYFQMAVPDHRQDLSPPLRC